MSVDSETIVYRGVEDGRSRFVTDGKRLERVRSRIVADIQSTVEAANATGVVVAMSGGIDSTVTAALAVEALGSDRVIGLGLPCHKADRGHVDDARTIADGLGIEFHEVQLRPLLEAFEETFATQLESVWETDRPNERNHAIGNVIARMRMCCTYYVANRRSMLVLGTANRSELLLGYVTKHGDGAADSYPIGDLYKTEVRGLAKRLGIPKRIVSKEPTAGFWIGQTDADELGAPYDVIDPFLSRIADDGLEVTDAARVLGFERETADAIASRFVESAHKRVGVPTPDAVTRVDPIRRR
ncbi:NAD+ synthase [Natrialba sp. INN-245]|uniref:NAD+ synthase n=1 Tax=Natrialba sp. INN-245 TaxID=2690967 RepID=UPI00130FD5EA|nr:NAD+ synthase [Natrialba sp. INN-245]MWV40349.1 NAD+ synthase [Natrialba sp. INN-245]